MSLVFPSRLALLRNTVLPRGITRPPSARVNLHSGMSLLAKHTQYREQSKLGLGIG